MRNIDKKWALFAISTIVCMYGICYTLLNITFAINTMPVDKNFDDINFYKCVIDSYNSMYSLDIDYDEKMDYDKLKNLRVISCNNKELMDRDKIVSLSGIELITSLEELSLNYTNVTNVNLSKNSKLKKINLDGNVLTSNLYVYNGDKIHLNNALKLSNDLVENKVFWNTSDKTILDISFYGMASAKNPGVARVVGKSNLGYEVINNIYVINISSSKYLIDHVNAKIFIDDISSFNIEEIECNDENVFLELYYNGLELYVKYEDNIIKKFALIERDV